MKPAAHQFAIRQSSRTPKKLARVRLGMEPLEPRIALSSDGLVDVGTQPLGALSGKIAYLHAGHGWTADNLNGGAWSTQRGELFEMVEDLGNQDQMTFLADYLFRAGATVVPLRPVGYQPNEVVLDNDDVGVSFVGDWTVSNGSVYFGDVGDIPYLFTTTSSTETAYARYQPNITQPGFYPVYAWTKSGSNRAADQLYRVHHSGGITEVTVNHRRVGDGPVYLGTYYFATGTEGYVDVSNRSNDAGRVVVADMIRFGNGMGDINRGGGVSGKTRSDEAGLYWVKWHVDHSVGIPDSEYRSSGDDGTATVSLSPRYAEFMNNAADGSLSDRVFVSYHSNAGGGRGVLGLVNGNNTPSSATPNQLQLAFTLANEVNADLVAQNGQFEHNWQNRTVLTLDRSDIEFGEINNTYINNEFDATILEVAFHDNQLDAELLRDPRVRDAIARATYQGLVRYFHDVDAGQTPEVMLPGPVTHTRALAVAPGSVQLTWRAPVANSPNGDAATGYRIYVSRDGYGFDGGTYVDGGASTTATLTGLSDAGAYYFKIVAENAGGESASSEVLTATPGSGSQRLLVVNGFDRLDRTLNPREAYFSGTIDRVRPRQSNSRDYSVQAGEAIEASGNSFVVDGTSNEAIITGEVSLGNYNAVIWLSGEESSADDTFNSSEQFWVSDYLAAQGRLFVSGAEIGWDLDNLNNGRAFYENQLRANFVADDANTYNVQGSAGGIFAGLSFSFDNGSQFYDAQFPDVITANAGSIVALNYAGGTGGGAAVAYANPQGVGTLVNFGFPFETITTAAAQADVMMRVLDFFGLLSAVDGDFDDNGIYDCDDINALVTAIVNVKSGGTPNLAFDLTSDGNVTNADLDAWLAEAGAAGITVSGNPVPYGDADLNGLVDGQDFIAWNLHKFSSTSAWCDGDFNADGLVDGSDFIVWNLNKFMSADADSPPLLLLGSTTQVEQAKAGNPVLNRWRDRLFAEVDRGHGVAADLSRVEFAQPPAATTVYFAGRGWFPAIDSRHATTVDRQQPAANRLSPLMVDVAVDTM